ncbi:heat shock 70 kDa protein-like [Paramacrobiotus metropolitanus]|uniref:heat shock 70 kDa protein-like n=1 Tax=Paramacrobiotus metropolitanus TaxID=2943436 RepID=UPI002445F447|nr:heat shock 70 kDa protein-like [Paramacrobiotus metropolitanus]XP_055347672.1 heat shock 70 kDa protein-like [Paramacrobiotus metropolitanus]
MPRDERIAVGIDLGTTYSCIAVYRKGHAEAVQNDQGHRITPSVVCYHNGEKTVGEGAVHQAPFFPESTIYDSKRIIGRTFNDPLIQSDMKHWSFQVVNKFGKPNILIKEGGKTLHVTPEEVSAMVLHKLKEIAELYLEKTIYDAVITVPAYFTDAQRQATKDAATIAGINVLRLINEPTAAAIYHGVNRTYKTAQKLMVFDLGGGTLDISVLMAEPGMKFIVLGTHGDPHLGGKDFDNLLTQYLTEEYFERNGSRLNKEAIARLRECCETAKKGLSFNTTANILIPNFANNQNYTRVVAREEFERVCSVLFDRLLAPVKAALQDTGLTADDIHEVVLVGGSSRIPKVKTVIQEFFAGKILLQGTHPDESVASGAAVFAHSILGSGSTGANALSLVDVTPFTLGVDVVSGKLSVLIPKNSRLPAQSSGNYFTTRDNQIIMNWNIYEGESEIAAENRLLGKMTISGLDPAPQGVASATVTFDVDPNGVLNASAVDRKTGNKVQVVLDNDRYNLSAAEIERIAGEFSAGVPQAKIRAEQQKLTERLKEYAQSVRQTLQHSETTLPPQEYQRAMQNLQELEDWISENCHAKKATIILKQQEAFRHFRTILVRLT